MADQKRPRAPGFMRSAAAAQLPWIERLVELFNQSVPPEPDNPFLPSSQVDQTPAAPPDSLLFETPPQFPVPPQQEASLPLPQDTVPLPPAISESPEEETNPTWGGGNPLLNPSVLNQLAGTQEQAPSKKGPPAPPEDPMQSIKRQALEQLQSAADADLTPLQKVGIAMLAAENPAVAAQMLNQHEASRQAARNMLTQLGIQEMSAEKAERVAQAKADQEAIKQSIGETKLREKEVYDILPKLEPPIRAQATELLKVTNDPEKFQAGMATIMSANADLVKQREQAAIIRKAASGAGADKDSNTVLAMLGMSRKEAEADPTIQSLLDSIDQRHALWRDRQLAAVRLSSATAEQIKVTLEQKADTSGKDLTQLQASLNNEDRVLAQIDDDIRMATSSLMFAQSKRLQTADPGEASVFDQQTQSFNHDIDLLRAKQTAAQLRRDTYQRAIDALYAKRQQTATAHLDGSTLGEKTASSQPLRTLSVRQAVETVVPKVLSEFSQTILGGLSGGEGEDIIKNLNSSTPGLSSLGDEETVYKLIATGTLDEGLYKQLGGRILQEVTRVSGVSDPKLISLQFRRFLETKFTKLQESMRRSSTKPWVNQVSVTPPAETLGGGK